MTDQELLQAIGQVVEAKIEPIRQDIHALKEDVRALKDDVQVLKDDVQVLKDDVQVLKGEVQALKGNVQELQSNYTQLEAKVDGIRVYIDTDLHRTLGLLLEGQQALWDRFVPHEKFGPLEDRTEVLELTVRRNSQEIRALQFA